MAKNLTCTFKLCLKLLKLVYHKRFCVACRWVHCMCDNIQTDEEAEMCAEDGYRCMLCRPKDVKLPHLLAGALHRSSSTPTRSNSPGKIVYSSVKKSCFKRVNVVYGCQPIYVAIDQDFQRLDLLALKQGLYKNSSEVVRLLGVAMPFFLY